MEDSIQTSISLVKLSIHTSIQPVEVSIQTSIQQVEVSIQASIQPVEFELSIQAVEFAIQTLPLMCSSKVRRFRGEGGHRPSPTGHLGTLNFEMALRISVFKTPKVPCSRKNSAPNYPGIFR